MRVEINHRSKLWFVITVITIMTGVFLIHYILLPVVYQGVVVTSYSVHLIFSLISFFFLSKFGESKGEYLGYALLVLTMVKFAIYFAGFRWFFMQDDIVSKLEYSIFFIPYLIALIVEVLFIARSLNSMPMDRSKIVQFSDEEEE